MGWKKLQCFIGWHDWCNALPTVEQIKRWDSLDIAHIKQAASWAVRSHSKKEVKYFYRDKACRRCEKIDLAHEKLLEESEKIEYKSTQIEHKSKDIEHILISKITGARMQRHKELVAGTEIKQSSGGKLSIAENVEGSVSLPSDETLKARHTEDELDFEVSQQREAKIVDNYVS
jgi:hypothetical protein